MRGLHEIGPAPPVDKREGPPHVRFKPRSSGPSGGVRSMNNQERQVISDIFRRLEQVAAQPRDPGTERFIADKIRQQPYAPYAMAQAVYVQEQALTNLQAENERLRAELDQASRRPQSGGLLSSIFGGGSRPPEPSYNTPPARQASPWGNPSQQPYG